MTFNLLFQAPNGVGLGHISRLAAIAVAVRDRVCGARPLFLVEGGDHLLLESMGLPCLFLPNRRELVSQPWSSWNRDERRKLIEHVARCVLEQLEPRAVIFDTLPFPPVLQATKKLQIPAILCLRKRRDLPEVLARLEASESPFRLILFPHDPTEVVVPPALLHKTRFVGPIIRPAVVDSGKNNALGQRRIVITGGAGGHEGTVAFYNLVLEAISGSSSAGSGIDTLLVTGPLFRAWQDLRLGRGTRITPFVADLASIMASADLVVCQGGYNTIAEVAALGVHAICIPAPRLLDDQAERAVRVGSACPQVEVFHAGTAGDLGRRIDSSLAKPRNSPRVTSIGTPGATRAAEAIMEVINNIHTGLDV
jgi:UDP-N-acetylglucosamine:LPS N-acetylglucosamine transferase